MKVILLGLSTSLEIKREVLQFCNSDPKMGATSIKSEQKPLKKKSASVENRFDNTSLRSQQRVRKKHDPEDKCLTVLRSLLHCYNVFILVVGCGVLGVGVWLLVKEYSAREITVLVDSHLFEYVTYGLTAGGGAVTILAFCGCCGTMRQDKLVLGFYGTVLTLVFVLLGIGCALALVFRGKLSEKIKENFKYTIGEKYGVNTERNSENRLITEAWDSMQQTLECCGAYGDVHNSTSWAIYKQISLWHKQDGKLYPYVPESCCAEGPKRNLDLCQGRDHTFRGPPVSGPLYENGSPQPGTEMTNEALYTTGCYDKVIGYLKSYSIFLSIVAGIIPGFLLAGIIISFYLCAKAKDIIDDDEADI